MKTNTITTYICDHCGKAYNKMSDAAACEAKHVEEKHKIEKQEQYKKNIETMTEKLSAMLQEYYDNYHEVPNIHIMVKTNPTEHCSCKNKDKDKNPIETILDTYFF